MADHGRTLAGGIVFYESLRAMVRAGVPLTRALASVRENLRGPWHTTMQELERQVAQGQPLSESMARFPEAFPTLERSLVRAGEQGGRMEEAIDQVLLILKRRRALRSQVIQAAIYPVILVHVAILVPGLSVWFQNGLIEYLGTIVPALLFVYGAAGAAVAFNTAARTSTTVGASWDSLKLRLPIVGGLFERAALARFARCLAALLRSGVPMLGALDQALDTLGNRVLKGKLQHAVRSVEKGERLSDAIAASGAFPHELHALVETGEQSGAMDDCLDHVADMLEDQLTSSIGNLTKVLPVVLLLMAMAYGVYRLIEQFLAVFGAMGGLGS